MAFLLSRSGAAMIAIVVALGLLTFALNFAYQTGRQVEREAVLSRSIEILRERNATDDEIKGFDDAALCRALGGVFADGSCQ